MGRTFLVLAVIGAFVLGSIVTGTLAFAGNDDSEGNPFKKIVKELKKISKAIEGIGTIQGEQGPEGPQGPQGEQGPVGPEGPTGVMNIYEISALSLVPMAGGTPHRGNDVELRCEDGDWFLVDSASSPVVLSYDVELDVEFVISRGEVVVADSNPVNIQDSDLKPIGWNGRAEQNRGFQSVDIPVTITGLCLSPAS